MSAEGAHVWKVGEGELMNPPMLSSPWLIYILMLSMYSFSLNTRIILNIHIVDGHYLVIISIIIILF